jgi:hypothetical protein
MWPGIPTGKGSTCAEEGCGNVRRRDGNECRPCYKQKHKRHKRALAEDPNSWSKGGTEVAFNASIVRELDAKAYDDWASGGSV